MAKKKTEKTSPFVPVEEQPYPVPENWCWVYIKSLASLVSKGTTPKGGKTAYHDSGIPFLRVENIKDDGTISMEGIKFVTEEEHNNFLKRSRLHVGDVLVSIAGTLGKTSIVTEDCVPMNTNQAIAFIRLSNKSANPKFLKLAIDVPALNNLLLSKTKVTSIPNLTLEIVQNLPVPLPPLAEQQRIVDRIESLFAKLDEAKEKVQEALDSFEPRKTVLLHKAFSGELTEGWRKGHNVSFDGWKNTCWGDLITSIEAGKNWNAEGRPPEKSEFGVVKVSSVTWGEFNELESKTCTSENQWNENVQIHEGNFLFSRANTLQLVGNCVIVKKISRRLMLSDKILRFTFSDTVDPRYILYFTRSDLYRQQIEQLASGNQDGMRNVSQKNMKLVEFPIASLPEQAEIIRILDAFFELETQAKDRAEAALEAIDTMKKSILAKAFRGELGTNNPEDESTEELLKRTLA